jgi:hypothetical protein
MIIGMQARMYALVAVIVLALLGGFWGGWQIRGWLAHSQALLSARAAAEARQLLEVQLNQKAADYERVRAELDARLGQNTTKIREIYRNVEVPADCAAPAAARGLLVSLGATGAPAAAADPAQPNR